MKIYANIIYKTEFELPDLTNYDDAYDMAVSKLLECDPKDLDINMDICVSDEEYYGEMM